MSEQRSQASTPSTSLSDAQVADYLRQHSDFFVEHAELLAQLQIPHAQKGTVSLVERQLDTLREQNQSLKDEIEQMVSTAARNETIYRVYSELYIDLLKCEQLSQVQQTLRRHLAEKLGLPVVQLRLVADRAGQQGQLLLIHDDAEQVISRRLQKRPYYFGRLSKKESWLLFPEQQVESVALMLIGDNSSRAILAIGSDEPNRFQPDMDGLLLEQLRALLTTLIPRMLSS